MAANLNPVDDRDERTYLNEDNNIEQKTKIISENTTDQRNHEEREHREEDPLNTTSENNEKPKKSCSQFCSNFFSNITVEPPVSLFLIAFLLNMTGIANLSLQKACRVNLNFTDDICMAMQQQQLDSQNEYERDAQKLVSTTLAWKTYISATIPCILALFIGPWQDKTGHRKVFFLIPIMGQIVTNLNNMLNVYFFKELNLQMLIYSDAIIEALSGGICVFVMTIFAFISAITNNDNRTFRMGMVNFCFTVSFPIGAASSGFLLKRLGYYGIFTTSLAIHVFNLLYTIFVLKDPKRSSDQRKHDKKGVGHFFRTFFDLRNVRDTIVVVFKKGPNNRRIRMIVLLLIVTILFGPMFGEISVLYLSTRYRFNWDEVKFSLYQSYNFIIHTIGTIFSITVFSKYLQWHDSMLGIISTISKIAASFIYCFAPNENIFYIGPLVEILNGTSLLALRSIVSKLVAQDELGKVNSVFALTENLMPLVYVPLYTKVYSATMEVLPGAVFLVGSFMTLPAVVVFILLFVEHRMGLKKNKLNDIDASAPLNVT